MVIRITCPYCNFSKEIPANSIPAQTTKARCPKCGQTFPFNPGEYVREPSPSRDKHDDTREDKGYERDWSTDRKEGEKDFSPRGGFFQSLFYTIKAVLFDTASFFKSIPEDEQMGEALSFGLLLGSIGSMFGLFWQALAGINLLIFSSIPFFSHFAMGIIFLSAIVIIPLTVALGLFLKSAVIEVCLLITGAEKNGFLATFRAVTYSEAPEIFSVIPLIGSMISWIWGGVILIIGLKEGHETSYTRVIVALLIPLVLILIIMVMTLGFFFTWLNSY